MGGGRGRPLGPATSHRPDIGRDTRRNDGGGGDDQADQDLLLSPRLPPRAQDVSGEIDLDRVRHLIGILH